MVAAILVVFLSSSFFYITQTQAHQARAPHGLSFESPLAFAPSAYNFFHPNSPSPKADRPDSDCDESGAGCAPMPLFSASSAIVRATPAHESKISTEKSSKNTIGVGGIAGIVFGFVFVVLLVIGVYYVMRTRRNNMERSSNSIEPDVC